MDLRGPFQMRRESFEEMPFLGFDPNRVGRSKHPQLPGGIRPAEKTNGNSIAPSLRACKFIIKSRSSKRFSLSDVCVCSQLARNRCRCNNVKGIVLIPSLDIGVIIEGIDIVRCRQTRRICHLNEEAAADRFRRFDDALDDLVPAGRFDNGVVNCRDQIAVAMWFRHSDPPHHERGNTRRSRAQCHPAPGTGSVSI